MKTIALCVCLFFFTNTGCSQELIWSEVLSNIRGDFPGVKQLSTDSLVVWLQAEDVAQPLLIDTREKAEYDVSHLDGALQLDPETEDFSSLDEVAKDTPIVVYCSVGYRSSKIAKKLLTSGFTNVSNLEGSIFTWANDGHRVVKDGQPVSAVHPYNKVWGMLLKKELRSYE